MYGSFQTLFQVLSDVTCSFTFSQWSLWNGQMNTPDLFFRFRALLRWCLLLVLKVRLALSWILISTIPPLPCRIVNGAECGQLVCRGTGQVRLVRILTYLFIPSWLALARDSHFHYVSNPERSRSGVGTGHKRARGLCRTLLWWMLNGFNLREMFLVELALFSLFSGKSFQCGWLSFTHVTGLCSFVDRWGGELW